MKLSGYRRPTAASASEITSSFCRRRHLERGSQRGCRAYQGHHVAAASYGRLQFGEDLELTFRTLAGTGRNPNVAAAVVIGIEPKWTQRIVDEIAKTGKPVAGFSIERYGDLKTIEMAARKAMEFVQYATELPREPFSIQQLCMSTKCGESIPPRVWRPTRPSAACSSGCRPPAPP